MPLFLTIGYGDQEGYDRTSASVRDRAHAHDASLVARGMRGGRVGTPVQVRRPGGGDLTRSPGAFLRSDLPVAGMTLLEADDLEHAVELVSWTPCAVADGVVEVWPLLG
jgi:hypothetical protein